MRKSAAQEDRIRRAIRDIAVIDPIISTRKLQDALFDKGYKTAHNTPLDWRYVQKLRNKVRRQVVEDADREKVSDRISEMKEKYRMMTERLIRIIYYSDELRKEGIIPPSYKDQISAINTLLKYDILLFNAQLDAGIFERHLGTLEIEQRSKPLPPELKNQMLKAFVNWGVIPKEALHAEPTAITIKPKGDAVVER